MDFQSQLSDLAADGAGYKKQKKARQPSDHGLVPHTTAAGSVVSLELDLAAIRGHPVKSGQQLKREGRRWVLL